MELFFIMDLSCIPSLSHIKLFIIFNLLTCKIQYNANYVIRVIASLEFLIPKRVNLQLSCFLYNISAILDPLVFHRYFKSDLSTFIRDFVGISSYDCDTEKKIQCNFSPVTYSVGCNYYIDI